MTVHLPRGQRATLLASALLPLMLVAACGSDPDRAAAQDAPAAASPSPTSIPSATSEAPVSSPLEGTWSAGPISLKDTEATLRRFGLGQWVEEYRANAPFQGDTVLSLTIENGAWDLYGASDGGQPEPIDYDAEYEIDGDTVTFHHSDGSNTYAWSLGEEGSLHLELVRSTMPAYQGIPDEVFQRALYMTNAFTQQG